MTAASTRPPAALGGSALSDTVVVTWRNLKRIPRIPELAAFAILQSVMFVLLFAYVFGGAIAVQDGSYREFLMPGIFAQTLAFASATTTIGITDDMQKGLVDRFRSLPMVRSAFLTGRTFADVAYNAGILVVLMLSGLLVGWRVRDGVVDFLAGFALALLFAYAMSWLGVFVGQLVPTVEVAQQVAFTTIFPITFLSNAFVPLESLPELAAAVRRVEPGEHADPVHARALRQPGRPARRRVPGRAPDPADGDLVDRVRRGVRAAGGAALPGHLEVGPRRGRSGDRPAPAARPPAPVPVVLTLTASVCAAAGRRCQLRIERRIRSSSSRRDCGELAAGRPDHGVRPPGWCTPERNESQPVPPAGGAGGRVPGGGPPRRGRGWSGRPS